MAKQNDFRVTLSETAIAELSAMGRWISEQSDMDTANRYIARVQAACDRLSFFPNRGTPRFDILPGLRTIVFERRTIIAYRVEGRNVIILRVLHSARDFPAVFAPEE
jgi:toxin ParE1/3/4